MNRIIKTIVFPAVYAARVISAYQITSACQVDVFYYMQEGALAASIQETFNAAIKVHGEGSKEKLADLRGAGQFWTLIGGIKVQVSERSVEFAALRITFAIGERMVRWGKLTVSNYFTSPLNNRQRRAEGTYASSMEHAIRISPGALDESDY